MPTKKCCLCKNPVLKNQSIAVISLPLKCTSDNGDYGMIGEFFDKERITHYDCLMEAFPGFSGTILGIDSSSTWMELYSTLLLIGEKVSKTQIRQFVKQNENIKEIHGLATLWFTKRNVFG